MFYVYTDDKPCPWKRNSMGNVDGQSGAAALTSAAELKSYVGLGGVAVKTLQITCNVPSLHLTSFSLSVLFMSCVTDTIAWREMPKIISFEKRHVKLQLVDPEC